MTPLRIITTGLVARHPLGGVAWDYLQYAIGLARMGHDVVYHEDTGSWPFDPVANTVTADSAYSTTFLAAFVTEHAPELVGRWHYRHLGEASFGMDHGAFTRFARSADLFLNVSGASVLPDGLSDSCLTVFIDTDPGYNQIVLSERPSWSENVDAWAASVAAHRFHVTYAENIGRPDCLIPTLGFSWGTTRMPVVLDCWSGLSPPAPPPRSPFTTVTTWDAFKGPLLYGGVEYRSKGEEFDKLQDLPRRAGVPLCVAVGGCGVPRGRLADNGWEVLDGPAATRTPADYQRFIESSAGELSPAKQVYVAMRTGWFSCRSACYLAAGRPVVVQDTAFPPDLRSADGLLAFSTPDEAIDALAEVAGDHRHHTKAALEVARAHFSSDLVLGRLLESL